MVAVFIDPLVCHTWAGWIIPECWGIIPFIVLPVALACAMSVRRLAVRRA